MKNKNTKRALLMSVFSMMLCTAMLIGSTFAWFTDSVTSGKNKIVAGNLDVELYHTNGNVADEKVGETTNLFTDKDGNTILWEPGVMVYENFTVKNVGSLALKYKLTVNVGDFNTVTVGEEQKSLKDVLRVAILDQAFTGDRAAAQALTFDKTVADFEKDGNIAAGAADNTYAIVIYWEPSAVDNDYNLNNGRKSSDGEQLFIDLGVNLIATQDTVESDSFDESYDKSAWTYPTKVANPTEMKSAIAETGNVQLAQDITEEITDSYFTDPIISVAANTTTDLDFAGHKLTILSNNGKNGIKGGKNATISLSNGEIVQDKVYGSSYPVIHANYGTVVLEKMTVVNSTKSGVTVSAGSNGGVLKINKSTIEGGASAVFCGSSASVMITDSTVIGCIKAANNGKIEIKGGDYTQADFDSDYKENIIIYSGLFKFDPQNSTEVKLADNTSVKANGDGTWSVTAY